MNNQATEYSYRILWSSEDGAYVATVTEFPSLSWVADSQLEALSGIVNVVAETLIDMEAEGEQPPIPFGSRRFSGKFALRLPQEVHRQLAIEAAEQKVSINQLILARL